MVGKPTRSNEQGAEFLKNNPDATAEVVARASGLTVSAVQKTSWWRMRPNRPTRPVKLKEQTK